MDLRPLASPAFLAVALAFTPRSSFGQPVPVTPPAGAGAPPTAAQVPDIRREVDRFKEKLRVLSGGISLSGFFDVQATNRGNDPITISTGALEVDLAKEIGRNGQVAAAVVLNRDGPTLAVAFVDVHLFGALIAPRGRLPVEKGFHVQLGRFDLPFGNDWRYFATRDRIELSAPLTTEAILGGGYNDTGLRALGNTGSFNYSVFVLRGHGSRSPFGARLGFTPLDNPYQLRPRTRTFEVGVSLLQTVDGEGLKRETSLALDSEVQVGRCRVRAEYLEKRGRPMNRRDAQVVQSGWHVTAALDSGEIAGVPTTPYVRYDTTTIGPPADGRGERRTDRLAAGLNAAFFRLVTLKVEYQRILATVAEVYAPQGLGRDSWFAQAVVVF